MDILEKKFAKLNIANSPGQEARQQPAEIQLKGEMLPGRPVDFSHGDVNAFAPVPGALDEFMAGVGRGGEQAYTEYRGNSGIREDVAGKLAAFTGAAVSAENGLILTPGTQGALFLAMGATLAGGDKVAIIEPDYYTNRMLVQFLEGELVPVQLDYLGAAGRAGLNLDQLETAFQNGVKLFLFSNPNNPTGAVYSPEEIQAIAALAQKHGVTVIVDELYSRQIFDGRTYTHLCAVKGAPENLITIIGPSKTESLSGYRLGAAFGLPKIIDRMETLQAIVSIRAAGYNQAALKSWFAEPDGWMKDRIAKHQAIRDDLAAMIRAVKGMAVRMPEGGSYLFPRLPGLTVSMPDFVKLLRLQAGVTVTPGTEFGPQFTDSIRLNFSQDHEAAVKAMERIIQLVERYRA